MSELLLGCGNDRRKKIHGAVITPEWTTLTTLDMDPSTGCDVVHDLNVLPYPFANESFDEIHAYEVLEHCGRQGDWRFFLDQFAEFYRMLKPDGYFVASCPMWDSQWAWGDPGHTRMITVGSLIYLNREEYEQVGRTAMSDYRPWLRCDFHAVALSEEGEQFGFILQARK